MNARNKYKLYNEYNKFIHKQHIDVYELYSKLFFDIFGCNIEQFCISYTVLIELNLIS